jgi:hypothetical protein
MESHHLCNNLIDDIAKSDRSKIFWINSNIFFGGKSEKSTIKNEEDAFCSLRVLHKLSNFIFNQGSARMEKSIVKPSDLSDFPVAISFIVINLFLSYCTQESLILCICDKSRHMPCNFPNCFLTWFYKQVLIKPNELLFNLWVFRENVPLRVPQKINLISLSSLDSRSMEELCISFSIF